MIERPFINKLYTMNLHEVLTPKTNEGNMMIIRVPGGWIYYNYDEVGLAGTFVQFNNEFKKDINNG